MTTWTLSPRGSGTPSGSSAPAARREPRPGTPARGAGVEGCVMELESMYRAIILDHYRHPHHRGRREPFDAEVHHVNPTCGDEVTLRVTLKDAAGEPAVADVSYDALGCSISQASASVLTDLLIGRPVAEAMTIQNAFLALMQSRGEGAPGEDLLGDAVAFEGVSRYPARVKCALLAWMAWKDATARALESAADQSGAASTARAQAPDIEDIVEALRDVVDPELGINVVDLGLVYDVSVGKDRVATIDMTLTSAACPLTDVIEDQARVALDGLVPDFRINWVWMPPWGPDRITEDGRDQLRALGFNV